MQGQGAVEMGDAVTMGPDCTIRGIRHVQAQLRDHRTGAATVRVDCGDVRQVDITFVQVIASAEATFAGRGTGLVLDPVADCVREAFQRAGVPLPGAAAPSES